MKNICIVGAGTAGLISSLIIKQALNVKVTVIKSDKIGIIGVGEGSENKFTQFLKFCNINKEEIIKETGATLKYGILFEGWTNKDFIHEVSPKIFDVKKQQYLAAFGYAINNNLSTDKYTQLNELKNNKVVHKYISDQFHFDTFKLNSYLINKCKERNIEIIEDEVSSIQIKNNKIFSLNKKYKFDFFIDATGFKKLLMNKLGGKWNSYSKYLPMNEAIAFPTKDTKDYPAYTLAKAMSAGWMWRIPVQDRWGNGYVFDNRYISADQAKQEVEKYLGYKIEIGKNIKFNAGAIDKAWIGNCVAIGLSANFIEPLEASSIGSCIQQSFLLINNLPNYNSITVNEYNKSCTDLFENIRDFVLMHYLCNKKDSKFWKDLSVKIPDTLKLNLKKWQNRLPVAEDFSNNYILFYETNFALILKELNLIKIDTIKREYKAKIDISDQKAIENYYKTFYYYKKNLISHKKYIKEINEYI
jgi:tryptophan halogenase